MQAANIVGGLPESWRAPPTAHPIASDTKKSNVETAEDGRMAASVTPEKAQTFCGVRPERRRVRSGRNVGRARRIVRNRGGRLKPVYLFRHGLVRGARRRIEVASAIAPLLPLAIPLFFARARVLGQGAVTSRERRAPQQG